MSFSDDLRDELASIAPRRRCCRLAELSALSHSAGAWHLRGHGELSVHLDLASAAAARRAFTLLRELGVRSEIRTYRRHAFERATRYQLHVEVDETAAEALREAGVLSARGAPLSHPPKRVVGRPCCRGAYLRGALLGWLPLGAEKPAPRAARERPGRGRAARRNRRSRGGRAEDDRAQDARRRLRQVGRDGRRSARARGRERDRPAPGRARGRRRDPVGGEPARKCRRSERETHGRCRPEATGGDPRARPQGAPGQARGDRSAADQTPVRVAGGARQALPARDQQGRRAPPDDGAGPAGAAAGASGATARPRRLAKFLDPCRLLTLPNKRPRNGGGGVPRTKLPLVVSMLVTIAPDGV